MECDKNMSFEDCELAVLRSAVDKIEKQTGRKKIENVFREYTSFRG